MYSPMIYLLADVFIINACFQKQLGSGFSPQVASIFKIFNCSVNWLNIKMHSYNFCQYIVKMLVFTKFKETLKKKIRNGMKLTTSEINYDNDTFPCNITKGTLNFSLLLLTRWSNSESCFTRAISLSTSCLLKSVFSITLCCIWNC